MSKRIFKIASLVFLTFLVVGGWLFLAHQVLAQANGGSLDVGLTPVQQNSGLAATDIRLIVARIIRAALGLLGIVALVIVLYGGLTWMTAGGNPERIEQSKKILLNAVIGLVIIFSSFAIVSFVISRLMSATNGLPAHCYNGVQDEDETDIDTGGSCGSSDGGGGGGFDGSNTLYVSSLPGKNACVLNPHPTIIFSLPVNLGTVSSSVLLQEVSTSSTVPGVWKYGHFQNEAEFVPTGSCAPAPGTDCLKPNTDYILTFQDPSTITTLDGKLTLNCLLKAKCNATIFTSGNKVDTDSPTVTITAPIDGSSYAPGTVVPISVRYADDSGIQQVAVYASPSSTYQQNNAFPKYSSVDPGFQTADADKGDFNNDGYTDIVLGASPTSSITLLINDKRGGFVVEPITDFNKNILKSALTYSIRVGDVNGDKKDDIVAEMAGELWTYIGNGGGTFQQPVVSTGASPSYHMVLTDLNNDGKPDIVGYLTHWNTYYVMMNNGGGSFALKEDRTLADDASGGTPNGPSGVAVADMNGDGKKDLVFAKGITVPSLVVMNGRGDGTFTTGTIQYLDKKDYVRTSGLVVHDFNNDGKPDIALNSAVPGTNNIPLISIFINNGNGSYAVKNSYQIPPRYSDLITLYDLNDDGREDIIHYSYVGANLDYLVNNGDGTFNGPLSLGALGATGPGYLVLGDFNRDGLVDYAAGEAGKSNVFNFAFSAYNRVNNPQLIDSKSFDSCFTSGNVTVNWNTVTAKAGKYVVEADAKDWVSHTAVDFNSVSFKPLYCLNGIKDGDESDVDCGGSCGACAGNGCQSNSDCASGYCEKVPGAQTGICIAKMQITKVDPMSGAAGTWVTISGRFFGEKPGHVYFAKVQNPQVDNPGDWIEASFPQNCSGSDLWTQSHIIAVVPPGAVDGPLMVVTDPIVGKDGVSRTFSDVTNDAWGPIVGNDGIFRITNVVHPGLCGINPTSGNAGDTVVVNGQNFGLLDNGGDKVYFGSITTTVAQGNWGDTVITTVVPNDNIIGPVTVQVSNNGVKSNSVVFTIKEGVGSSAPVISSVTPDNGAQGEYITIIGKNFGNTLGSVWFKKTSNSQAIPGDFNFPKECGTSVWTDNQIVVKFPAGQGSVGTVYAVQVNTAQNKTSSYNTNNSFQLEGGTPHPGLCKISPVSGPVPFPAGKTITLSGEYFKPAPTGTSDVYFWSPSASATSTAGRLMADTKDLFNITATRIAVRPVTGTASGPVVAYRPDDKKMSNPLAFSVTDCTKNNTSCNSGYHCCVAGAEKGFCKADGDSCDGTLLETGYLWKFSTKDIPPVPHIVERCDANTDLGKNMPSPSPSVQWDKSDSDDNHNVCRTAVVNVEFSTLIDQKTVDATTVRLNRCTNVNGNSCQNPTPQNLAQNSFLIKQASMYSQSLAIQPAQNWQANTWYQIVISKNIKSAGSSTSSAHLAIDKPCNGENDSAYCFVFKTDDRDCKLKDVVVSPTSYWTNRLESPVQYLADITKNTYKPVDYWGNGLSDQHCVLMDVSGFAWDWNVDQNRLAYASIYKKIPDSRMQHVAALGNTVAIGLQNPDDAVHIEATASTNTPNGLISKTGVSPLTIDLSSPAIVNTWPNCLEACTNAEIAVQFNVSMSTKNLEDPVASGSVQLLKCLDANCAKTDPVKLPSNAIHFEQGTNNTILKIANSGAQDDQLEPDTLYEVMLSTSSTDPNAATKRLWSAAELNQWQKAAKPLNEQYVWRFRTKRDRCQISRVDVDPAIHNAAVFDDRAVYRAIPYSSPDSCSANGQKLNAWTVDWTWKTSNAQIAAIDTFKTVGHNLFCTARCVRKGSTIPSGGNANMAVCGNGKVEAGEDCDKPNKQAGCGLDCRLMGSGQGLCGNGQVDPGEACDTKDPKTQLGCTAQCLHSGSDSNPPSTNVNASICGKDGVSAGEDCDLGIALDISNAQSAFNCNARCLHTGTRLSTEWCANQAANAGFTNNELLAACKFAVSQCGNGVDDPDEDPGCDSGNGKHAAWCNQYCIVTDGGEKEHQECVPGTEGCNDNGQHLGSSIEYSAVSSCGDGKAGIGEDAFCESNLIPEHANLFDPWVVARGIGIGIPQGNPPELRATISAETLSSNKSIKGSGDFVIACGYKSNADCEAIDPTLGVGSDTCCYARTKLLSTIPLDNAVNVCPNTAIEAQFKGQISARTVTQNALIVKKVASPDCGEAEEYTNLFTQNPGNIHWCAVPGLATAKVAPDASDTSTSRISLSLTQALDVSSDYGVVLKPEIKDARGVTIAKQGNIAITWQFSTGAKMCEVKGLNVVPPSVYFSRANATSSLMARVTNVGGQPIQPIPGVYNWQYTWGPLAHPSVIVPNVTTSDNIMTAQNRNGEVDVYAGAIITENKVTSVTGTAATGRSHVVVFLCENPWPPKDLMINNQNAVIFPYEDKIGNNDAYDLNKNVFTGSAIPASAVAGSAHLGEGYYNFSTYYCADNGSSGVLDDLPYLRPTVQVDNKIVSASSSLKRFIFTNYNNSDAVGIQVFRNDNHLSPEEWYHAATSTGGQGFVGNLTHTNVDGLDAVSDGNNIYVDVIDYSPKYKSIYSNIYLLSINADAKSDTRRVFEQVVKNMHFNSNLTNYGYCGNTVDKPEFKTACKTDFDCSSGQVCSVQIDKLRRDYTRMHDFRMVDNIFESFAKNHGGKYPDLKAGTFLAGQDVSTWGEWSLLGAVTGGVALPKDPINKLGKAGTCTPNSNVFCTTDAECGKGNTCTLHDPATGWSTSDRRFSFACATTSLAYRYIASSTSYAFRSNIEDPGLDVVNGPQFISSFNLAHPNYFTLGGGSGICIQDQEISTISQGTCGDGVVNIGLGEECDGVKNIDTSQCNPDPVNGMVVTKACGNTCKWQAPTTQACVDYYKNKNACGNGKIDPGEQCDDGGLNGRYNKCSKSCTILTQNNPGPGFCGDGTVQQAYEVCDYMQAIKPDNGWCVGGIQDGKGCNTDNDCWFNPHTFEYSQFGFCQLVNDVREKYAYSKSQSCSYDCQSSGPYCGNGVIEIQYGEECDPGVQTTCQLSDSRSGKRLCSNTCKFADSSVAWWKFNDLVSNADFNRLSINSDPCAGKWWCNRALADWWHNVWSAPTAHAIVQTYFVYADASGNKLDGNCTDFGGGCPTLALGARPNVTDSGNAVYFDGTHSISVADNQLLQPTSTFSIEAWVKPTTFDRQYQRVVEKGGWNGDGGYGIEMNVPDPKDQNNFNAHRQRMVVWAQDGQTRLAVDSNVDSALNQWMHIVGTYVWQPPAAKGQTGNEILTLYINGKLAGTTVQQTLAPIYTPSQFPLTIGNATNDNQIGQDLHFSGYIDDLKVFNYALTSPEVADHYQNQAACQVKALGFGVANNGGMCGNGIVEDTEACDNGALNDVPCTPAYGKNCSWCRNSCKEVVDITPQQYCGNGIIEASEKCEIAGVDKNGNQILYASSFNQTTTYPNKVNSSNGYLERLCQDQLRLPYTLKKGVETCDNSCGILTASCKLCGQDDVNGVPVSGGIVNTLASTSSNPFVTLPAKKGDINLIIGSWNNVDDRVAHAYNIADQTYYLSPERPNPFNNNLDHASISAESMCSVGNEPTYKYLINSDGVDTSRQYDFDIFSDPKNLQPWKYDIVLNHIIRAAQRPNDIRVVVSWVRNDQFMGGWMVPETPNPITLEDLSFNRGNGQWSDFNYAAEPVAQKAIWYHGYVSTGNQLNVESFTIDTNAMTTGTYAFYVRTSDLNRGMQNYKSGSSLKVDVYFPENDNDQYHFAIPSQTYYLSGAANSGNARATYWSVFAVQKPINGSPAVTDRVVPINKIVTEPKQLLTYP